MRIQEGDIWSYHERGHWICVTTNGVVKASGALTMGKGIAEEAARRFPLLPSILGRFVREQGNRLCMYPEGRVISFPTKHHWRDRSYLGLIERSANELKNCWPLVTEFGKMAGETVLPICLPKVGCGNGGLDWNTQVRPLLEPILDDNYIVVT